MRVWQNFQKMHMCGVGVCGVKSYCAQSVLMCKNWLNTNTLQFRYKLTYSKCMGIRAVTPEAFQVWTPQISKFCIFHLFLTSDQKFGFLPKICTLLCENILKILHISK